MFSESQFDVIKYCSMEVANQMASPIRVHSMLTAWDYAFHYQSQGKPLTVDFVEHIGALVEPNRNIAGFRTGYVTIGSMPAGADPERIRPQLEALVEGWNEGRFDDSYIPDHTGPDSWYFEFERIHPFFDGNGRTGKILLNFLNDTLSTPIWPSNWFGTFPI